MLARQALEDGGVAPAVLNAANEVAVGAFLNGEIGFLDIASIVESCLSKALVGDLKTIEAICAIDQTAREYARQIVASR